MALKLDQIVERLGATYMLKLNIWTPSLTGKRSVMFYMHGGGFSFGSSYELPSHEGAQMARHHEVMRQGHVGHFQF